MSPDPSTQNHLESIFPKHKRKKIEGTYNTETESDQASKSKTINKKPRSQRKKLTTTTRM